MKHIYKILISSIVVLLAFISIASYAHADYYPYNYSQSYQNSPLFLSQNNVTLNAGQTIPITVSSEQPLTFSVTNNSNPHVATATVNGNTIVVYGNTSGTASFQVCPIGPAYFNQPYQNVPNNYTTACTFFTVLVNNGLTQYLPYNNPPTIAGVYLSQVPYTGIGSNTKVVLFVLTFAIWTGALAYLFASRKNKRNA